MTLRDRLQWIFRMALLAFILASVAFLSAITAMRFAIQGREVSVPDVTGKPSSEAQALLQGRGVGMKVEERLYNAAAADTVIRQSPAAGSRVKIGQYAHVVVSLGPQKISIPSVIGLSQRDATLAIREAHLDLGNIAVLPYPAAKPGTVIAQDPPGEDKSVDRPRVSLLVAAQTD